jgi:hypothetical protein
VAWSLVDPSERSRLRAVERLIKHTPREVVVQLPDRDLATIERTDPRQNPRQESREAGGRRPRRRNRRRAA